MYPHKLNSAVLASTCFLRCYREDITCLLLDVNLIAVFLYRTLYLISPFLGYHCPEWSILQSRHSLRLASHRWSEGKINCDDRLSSIGISKSLGRS